MMPVKTVAGRKRHLVVDSVGNLLAIAVDTAAMSDAAGARWVLGRTRARWPHLVKGWADQTYRGTLVDWARQTYDIDLEIVQRPAEAEGFVLLPRRWVVERTQPDYRARPRFERRPATCDHRTHRVAAPGRSRRAGASGARVATHGRGRAMSTPAGVLVPPRPVRARGAVAGSTCR
jgi:transposase